MVLVRLVVIGKWVHRLVVIGKWVHAGWRGHWKSERTGWQSFDLESGWNRRRLAPACAETPGGRTESGRTGPAGWRSAHFRLAVVTKVESQAGGRTESGRTGYSLAPVQLLFVLPDDMAREELSGALTTAAASGMNA